MFIKSISSLTIITVFMLMMGCTATEENMQEQRPQTLHEKQSNKPMGLTWAGERAFFRLFAPSATTVELVCFKAWDEERGDSFPMSRDKDGVWEVALEGAFPWQYYAYRINGPALNQYHYDFDRLIADPYARAVTRQNHYSYPSRTVILPREEYDWEGDDFTHLDISDMVILEAHLRDMTVHASARNRSPGTYEGFVQKDQLGGIAHLKDLGINAVEFLPLQEFGNIEIDYKNQDLSTYNDWNPYETNHWGYMTSFFFAPEIYYGSDGSDTRGEWIGTDGRAVTEFKNMVKELHREGIAVIMDVVYNHVSQYDENPYKYIDKAYYFRLDEKGDFLSHSYCGNDFRTESSMARHMIVESLLYWMEEYHIDGFRFDLAAMIDLETVDAITEATRKVNPDVILIGEPWGGGGYNPAELADHEWASWNDHFRNSVKGRNPRDNDNGYIFGKYWDGHDREYYKGLMRGYLQDEGGHYRHPRQSVNYLESHDDHTLGDFIRLSLGTVNEHQKLTRDAVATLSAEELKIHKLAALSLLTSQGPIMLAQGQSWGRAKVIAETLVENPKSGELDHNSYEKDDETNWLDWSEKALNRELVDYYRGLIAIRHAHEVLRDPTPGIRTFFNGDRYLSFGFSIKDNFIVLLNGESETEAVFTLPEGTWQILANADQASLEAIAVSEESGSISVPPQSGMILAKER